MNSEAWNLHQTETPKLGFLKCCTAIGNDCWNSIMRQMEQIFLELKLTVLNINLGHNEKLKEACKTLKDYTEYTHRVRMYAKIMPIEEAVERAITECIREGILADFLSENRSEAWKMSK